MSTRCNIIIKDRYNKAYLYRHHDGYPRGAGEDLKEFLLKQPFNSRSEVVASHLIIYGWEATKRSYLRYELTHGIHGDIDYLYVIDLTSREFRCYATIKWDQAEDTITSSTPVFIHNYSFNRVRPHEQR